MNPTGTLILEDGSTFSGSVFGFPASVAGEVVFTTGMTGYSEALTDPSYAGQILTFAYPLIGNYGIPGPSVDEYGVYNHFESRKIHVKAVILSEWCTHHNHWNARTSFESWLQQGRIPGISGIDTRALTVKLREKGVMLGKVVISEDIDFVDPNKENLVKAVSRENPVELGTGETRIVVVDCGVKNSIVRNLLNRNAQVVIVPWNYDFTDKDYDGVLLSNGPGDPATCQETIAIVQKVIEQEIPLFGICLGHQLLALAAGARSFKLPYGHRGQNQPVATAEKRGFITAQNHGFAVDTSTLSPEWGQLFYNVNDYTNEGIYHKHLPFFSVQFHPEGCCGPRDTDYLFDTFVKMADAHAR
ncbi:MAG: glutamine-hydrolyzing carbamoyl-phosphate synthase small subunit [Theionarchaea archaeon]|nr:glutamine-hydrolyzing carbamoyl-phosphate synthase small subunit [Theionarchaea archaeon]MBU7001071.1 glutamine-hydrolyzing carbamoyl-phosphate synthase small subunit [Theionarchaea archaeon]MBU7020560.1 glutamine-hydrolyzing carbamoyl-phosphate synthase small subunit [Theionarchaea archaeon]MBU7034173.1 glutamine-hydrolyzing carbamoyl-phosphate synthase small subunit [Theionarchaea archaeon]MBU7039283.1 glutamine-hydrolyzing carbamoyl-phosphate synthase small subunit [Theionarchaea archaeon